MEIRKIDDEDVDIVELRDVCDREVVTLLKHDTSKHDFLYIKVRPPTPKEQHENSIKLNYSKNKCLLLNPKYSNFILMEPDTKVRVKDAEIEYNTCSTEYEVSQFIN